jgi:hypothetical protein
MQRLLSTADRDVDRGGASVAVTLASVVLAWLRLRPCGEHCTAAVAACDRMAANPSRRFVLGEGERSLEQDC